NVVLKVEEAVENVGKRTGKEQQVAFWSENDMNTMPQHLAHHKCSIPRLNDMARPSSQELHTER
ncbi:hypothetical protein BT96DRAFT_921074, partial [Gymnopus androsaceus JB14]